MSHLTLLLLGPPHIERDGAVIEIDNRKASALLAYLAVTGPTGSHSRDELATLLWPDYDQSRARTNLRYTLWALKKALGKAWLGVERESIGLAPRQPDRVWLDVAHFHQLLASCRGHGHPADEVCPACLPLLTEAVGLYRADFMAGFTLPDSPAFDEWQFFQAESLRHDLAGALERLVRSHSTQGEFKQAIPYARRWLALDPLHEPTHRQLMQLYAWTGHQAAALRQYQECVRLLEQELGVPPEETTRQLYEAIKAKRAPPPPVEHRRGPEFSPSSQLPSLPAPQPLPPFPHWPAETVETERPLFVARERELAQLAEFLDRTLAGQGQVVFVTGEAGSGKTALVREFAWQAQERWPELVVAGAHCNAQTDLGDPYLPFRQILRLLTGEVEAPWAREMLGQPHVARLWALLPTTVQALVETGPDLVNTFLPGPTLLNRATAFGAKVNGWLERLEPLVARQATAAGDLGQRDLFEQYLQVLQSVARQQPLLLVVDDLQWADTASLSLLSHLGHHLQGSRILIIGTYRPDEVALGRGPERHPLEPVLKELKRVYGQIELDLDQAGGGESVETRLNDIVQQDPLLTTKLFVPGASRNLVSRPCLTNRLNQSLACALTVISAPAGYGKTTMLSEWIADFRLKEIQNPSFSWLTLDESDNDPLRFLSYLVAALQTVQSGVGETVLQDFKVDRRQENELTKSQLKPRLTTLINDIATISDDFILVLDDYHVISSQAVHDALTFLLDHLPPRMHLIVASRTQPPLPLARLRARDQLIELGTADLRFTPDEAATFLNQVMSLGLSAADIATLEARTEGWIAGLQMAALSMQDRQDLSGFIAAFSGSHRYILDYLAEEVLRRQPEPIQQFLLQTSILDRLCGPLCDAILSEEAGEQKGGGEKSPSSIQNRKSKIGNGHGQVMLEQIEQASLFINPLDDDRRWYRYHHLFATFLREQLQRRIGTQEMTRLHHRAAEWYEQNGSPAEAMSHAVAAADVERAVRLAEKSGRTLLRQSELATLRHWLESLPEELVRARPRLSLFQAWALVLTGQLDVVEARLSDFDLEASGQAEIPGEITAIRATVAFFRRDIPRAIEVYRQAFEELSEENLFLRGVVAMSLATAYNLNRDIDQAKWAFAQAAAINEANNNIYAALIATWNLAQLCVKQAQLQQAAEHYRRAIQLVRQQAKRDIQPPIAGRVYVGLGEVLYQWNDLEGATHHLLEGITLGKQSEDVTTTMGGYLALARVKQAQGNIDEALVVIGQAETFAQEHDLISWRVRLAALLAKLWLGQGNLEAAARWAQESSLHLTSDSIDDSAGYVEDLRQIERVTQARLCIAQASVEGDKCEQAMNLLSPLLQTAEATKRVGRVIEILMLQALAYQAQNDMSSALATLGRALSLAEPAGYIRFFVDEGPPMAELVRQATSEGMAPDYTAKLLAAFPDFGSPIQNRKSIIGNLLIEPLSEREIQILGLIAKGMSNRQIAEKLVLTEGTVKWHVNNLFGKLGVQRRTQAVARARELNLL